MRVEPPTVEDCQAIAEVHVASWQHAYRHLLPSGFLASLSVAQREAMWREAVVSGSPQLLVARGPQGIVGFIAFGPCRDHDAPQHSGEVWAFYVAPQCWAQGLGRKLWLAARERLAQQGHTRLSLWVAAGNERAIRFYLAAGFKPERQSIKWITLGGVPMQEIRYVRQGDGPAASGRESEQVG